MREFGIAEAFAKMAEVAAAVELETRHALERAARLVEHEAKAAIGEYQEAAGQFAAWAPLAPSTLAEKGRLGYAPPDNPLLREGDLRDSIGHEVETHHLSAGEAVIGSNSEIAVYQELGTSRMPARSFLGGAAVRKEGEVVELLGEGVVTGLLGGGVHLPLRE